MKEIQMVIEMVNQMDSLKENQMDSLKENQMVIQMDS